MSDDRASRGPARRPPGTLKVGSIAGSDVLISRSWFLVAALIAVMVAPAVDSAEPGLGGLKYVAGLMLAVLLYLSILVHEASHAIVAKRFGLPVSSITLHFLGGMTAIDGEPASPRQEFWVSVGGPISSLGVAAVAFALSLAAPGGLIGLAIGGGGYTDLPVGVINLGPGLPLDGGRVLKAGVWKVAGDTHRGTIVAAWGGRVVAVMAIGYPVLVSRLFDQPVSAIDFIFAGFIAMFLWSGATAALESAK